MFDWLLCFALPLYTRSSQHTVCQYLSSITFPSPIYLFERKVKATDRTKIPEETAKNGVDRLHAMESKRLARMAGDFLSEDEFSDISEEDAGGERGNAARRGRRMTARRNGVGIPIRRS